MIYKDELKKAMDMLGKDDNTIFLGQQIAYDGGIISKSLRDIDVDKKIELPLIEDCQMGMSIGLSLNGFLPVSIYQRIDFLVLAMNQIVNHLDKIDEMSCGQFKPKVIIRTAVGSTVPLNPGLQHCSDYTEMFKAGVKNIDVFTLDKPSDIFSIYCNALFSKKSSIIIEYADKYGDEE